MRESDLHITGPAGFKRDTVEHSAHFQNPLSDPYRPVVVNEITAAHSICIMGSSSTRQNRRYLKCTNHQVGPLVSGHTTNINHRHSGQIFFTVRGLYISIELLYFDVKHGPD